MAIIFVALWGNGIRITDPAQADASVVVVRPWGYEIRVDLTDGTHIFNECFVYASMPTKAKVRDDVLAKIAYLEARQEAEANPPKKTVTCQDGFVYRVPESICPVDIDLTINPTTAQTNAWNLIRPVLYTYLKRVMYVYNRCPDEYKAELRSHNTIMNQVLQLVED